MTDLKLFVDQSELPPLEVPEEVFVLFSGKLSRVADFITPLVPTCIWFDKETKYLLEPGTFVNLNHVMATLLNIAETKWRVAFLLQSTLPTKQRSSSAGWRRVGDQYLFFDSI